MPTRRGAVDGVADCDDSCAEAFEAEKIANAAVKNRAVAKVWRMNVPRIRRHPNIKSACILWTDVSAATLGDLHVKVKLWPPPFL